MKEFLLLIVSTCIISLSYCQTKIIMQYNNGVYSIPCKVNGLVLNFIFDTGASDVSISLTEAAFMLKNGYLNESDITGSSYAQIANGEITKNTTILIREIVIADITLHNISASIVHELKAPLLLGQSAISKLGKIQLNGSELTIFSKGSKSFDDTESDIVNKGNSNKKNQTIQEYLKKFTTYIDLKNGNYIVNIGGKNGYALTNYKIKGGKWGIVSNNQEILVPIIYDDLEKMHQQNLIIWIKDGKYGLFHLNGKIIGNIVFDEITESYKGYLWAKKKDKWGVVDSTGKIIIEPIFNSTLRSSKYNFENYSTIENDFLVLDETLINLKTLKQISIPGFKFVSNVHCGVVVIEDIITARQFLYNLEDQKILFESKYIQHYESCFFSYSNSALLKCSNLILNSSSGLISMSGKVIIKDKLFDGIQFLNDKYIGVCNNCKISNCSNAASCLCEIINGSWGAFDFSGKKVVDVGFELNNLKKHLKIEYNQYHYSNKFKD